jgi:hypothetical protein
MSQLFGVLAATKLRPRAPTNDNHTTKRILQPFRLPRTNKHRRQVNVASASVEITRNVKEKG